MQTRKGKKGVAALRGIPSAALFLGIAVIVVALIIAVLSGLATSVCTQNDGTEGTYTNSPTSNPTTGSYIGCCITENVTGGSTLNCTEWASSVALNSTEQGIVGLGTFNDFWGVLVLIVILSIVIVALYAVFPRTSGY